MRARHTWLIAASLTCLSAAPAAAQQAEGTATTSTQHRRGATADTPNRVDSLAADDLMRQGATDLASALTWLAGATPTSPTGTATGMIVDGLSASQVVVLRDGLPFARMAGSPDGPMVDLSSIALDPATIERIDVYRGAGPGGSGVAGGIVVNIITRRPQQGQEGFVRSISGLDGAAAPYRQELAAGGSAQLSSAWGVQLLGQQASLDAVDVNNDGRGDNPAQERLGGEAAVQWQGGQESLRFSLLGGSQTSRAVPAPSAPLEDQIDSSSVRLRVQGRWWRGQDVRLEHGTELALERHDFSKIVRASGATRPKADTTQSSARQTLLGTWFFADHDLQAELIMGGVQIERAGETGDLDPVSLADLGAGVSDTWYVSDHVEVQGRLYGDVHTGFGAGWNAQVSAIWKAHRLLSPRATLSRTRRIPTPEERFLLFDHSEVGYRVVGNPELAPESLRSLRLGLVSSPTKRLHLEVEGFLHDIDDAIVTAASAEGGATFSYVNAQGARAAGANASARIALPAGLSVRLSHAWLPVSEDEQGQPLPLRSQHSSRAELRGAWRGGDLEAWTDLQARSSLVVPAGSPAAPAYTLFGAGIRWQAFDMLALNLDVNNLLNQTNATWGPVPGLHALLNLELRARSTP